MCFTAASLVISTAVRSPFCCTHSWSIEQASHQATSGNSPRRTHAPMSDGYDPQKSRVAEDTLADFLRAPLTGDLTEVPGIGPAAVTKLGAGEDGDVVENTFQLIGKFLMLKVRAVPI